MQNFKKILSILTLASAAFSFNANADYFWGAQIDENYNNTPSGSSSNQPGVGAMIWCKNNNRVFRHQAGTTPDGYNQPVNTCSDYGTGVTAATAEHIRCVPSGSYEVALSNTEFRTCFGSDNVVVNNANQDQTETLCHSNGQIATTTVSQCTPPMKPITREEYNGLTSGSCVDGQTGRVNRLAEGTPSYEGCSRALGSLGISMPAGNGSQPLQPGQTGVVAATTASELNFVNCTTGLKGDTDLQSAEISPRDDLFDFSVFNSQINSNSQNQTLAEQGSQADGYFFKSDLLVSCENLGTEPWGEFRNKVNGLDTWEPSWRMVIRDMIGVADEDGTAAPGVTEGITFTEEEKSFIKRCTGPGKPALAKADVSNSEKYKELVTKVKRVATKGMNIMNAHRKLTEKCEALVYLTDIADYSEEYPMTAGSMKTTKKSFDGRITCEAYGAETQDYKACKTFVNTYDASMVAKTALNAGQGIHYQGQTMDRQAELSRQGQTGGIDHRGALGAQKDDIKDRANYATQTAVLDSAKLATLFAQLQAMPTRSKLKEQCSASFGGNTDIAQKRVSTPHEATFDKFFAAIGITPEHFQGTAIAGDTANDAEGLVQNESGNTSIKPSKEFIVADNASDICSAVVSSARGSARDAATSARARARANSSRSRRRGGEDRAQEASMSGAASLIMNDAMRSVAKQILAQTAVEAAASFMKAGMLNKQAKTIDELLKKIEGYDPSGDFVPPNTDLLAGPCAFDPSAEGCGAGVPLAARQVGFGSNSLSLGGGGFGSSGMNLDADTGFDNAATGGTGTSDRSNAGGPVGSLITGADKPSGFEGGVPGAASIKSSAATRSGGGGGGASAVGSTGGGGAGGGGAQAKGGAASGGKKIDYAGSSIGRLSGGRGVGRKPASKDAGANPFANMFKKGGPQNGTLNFRNPAGIGGKTGNIFDQISERYQVVQGKNLLLEYKEK